jgi:hypothetical protein
MANQDVLVRHPELPELGGFMARDPGVFKRCGYCARAWRDKEEFLNDPFVALAGRRANRMRSFIHLTTSGVLAFVHTQNGCYAKLLVASERLSDAPMDSRP